MKKIKPMIVAFAVLMVMSCNNEKKDTVATTSTDIKDVAKVAATDGKSVELTTADVPQPVSVSFSKKYPKAERVAWMQYEPIENDNMKMDEKYYYVHFNSDGNDYTSWYDNYGEWVKTSTKLVNNSGLPDAVNNTIKTQYPGYEIEEASKENDKDMDMYEVK
ncbi:MAG: PepSY-like domain-containing protein, partial [Ferruginibacter sp.]